MSIFIRLQKWASGQEENFTTEALCYFLDLLLERDPEPGVQLLSKLAGGRVKWTPVDARDRAIVISPQGREDEGQPDVRVEGPADLLLLEIKVEAPLGPHQLKRYRDILARNHRRGTLCLLTKYPQAPAEDAKPDVSLLWWQVADWLEAEQITDVISSHVRGELLAYLREKDMTLERVNADLRGGIESMRALIRMAHQGVAALKLDPRRPTGGGEFYGFSAGSAAQVWIGIDFRNPLALYFHADPVGHKFIEKSQAEGVGWIDAGGRWRWDIDLEGTQFFDREKHEQQAFLARELRLRIDLARTFAQNSPP